MKDSNRTREQPMSDLVQLRKRVAELEASEAKRKVPDEAMAQSEMMYRTLFEEALNPILVMDENGRYVDANPAALEFLECDRNELLGKEVWDFMPSGLSEQQKQEYLPFVSRRIVEMDYFIHGRSKTLLLNVAPLTLSGKTLIYTIGQDVTGRKRVEEALEDSGERYRAFFQDSRDGLFVVDRGGKVVDANQSALDLFGYTREDIGKLQAQQLYMNLADRERFLLELEHNAAVKDYELKLRKKDGTEIDCQVTATLWVGKDGGIPGYQGIIRDISEQRRAEELYMTLANSAEIGVYIVQDGKVQFANPYMLQYPGFSRDEVLGAEPLSFVHPEDREMVRENAVKMLKGTRSSPYEFRTVTKDGHIRWVLERVASILYKGKRVVLATHMDITEQKEARDRLEELEALESSILRAIPHAVIGLQERRIIFANDAVEDVFGWRPEELIGKDVRLLYRSDEEYEEVGRRFYYILETQQAYSEEIPYRHKDGRDIVCLVSNSRIGEALKEKRIVATFTDITERKQYEEQLKAALREKELLLSEIHHRVKNNLQVISSLLHLSSMRIDDQRAIDLLTDARAKIYTMALIHSRLYQSERFDRIGMASHVEELVSYLAGLYAGTKKITPLIEASEIDLSITQAVPCSLVLNELISNAFKHAFQEEQAGTIEVSMRRSAQDTILIRVKDDGVGLPEEIDIYETDSLGLKLVRNLVEKQLNGKIQVERNKGTEFMVEFEILKEGAEYGQNNGSR